MVSISLFKGHVYSVPDRREITFMYICGEILQRRLWIIYSSVSITASPTVSWWSAADVDFSFLFKISQSNFSGGWYGTKALQGLLRDDLTAFTYLRKRNSGSDFSGLNCSRSLWSKIWRTSLSSPKKKMDKQIKFTRITTLVFHKDSMFKKGHRGHP